VRTPTPSGTFSRICEAAPIHRPVALMPHKPLFQNTCGDVAPHIRYVPLGPRRRLLNLVASLDLRIVLSGHVHQYLDCTIDGVRHIWVPSTAFFLPDSIQERMGEKVTGHGLLEPSSEGYKFDLVCPDGVARNNLVEQPSSHSARYRSRLTQSSTGLDRRRDRI
jgi:hypothetical protein